jgi:hypothetical protein
LALEQIELRLSRPRKRKEGEERRDEAQTKQ